MIRFKDFSIKVVKKGSWLSTPEFEPLEETMLRLNSWIEENEILVLNVETLFIPNVFDGAGKRTSSKGAFKTEESEGESNWWYQIYRVWYKE